MKYKRITIDPAKMDGLPCIREIRIPVSVVVNMIAQNVSKEDILKYYPDLEMEDIREALNYAAESVRERTLPLV